MPLSRQLLVTVFLCQIATSAVAAQSPGGITGRITESKTGMPLSGAVVTVEGTRKGATSSADGSYRISGLAAGQYSVRVRRLGYLAITKDVIIDAEVTSLDMALEFVPSQLEQVVVTGNLSRTEAKSVSGSVSIITADEIEARGVTKVEEVFKTVPGVSTLSDGQFNFMSTITIRGGNSLYGNTAKVLVDGIEVASDYAINDVDPSTIERIEIFRGPQASTIYGSSASGGLIQIFTKKGDYSSRRTPSVEAKISAGYIETKSPYGSGAALTENTLALTGGGKDFSYRVGGGYNYQGEWIKNGNEVSPSLFGTFRLLQGSLLVEGNMRYVTRDFGWLYNPAFEAIAPTSFAGLNITKEVDVDRTQSYNVHLLYQAAKGWKHELNIGFDQTSFDWWSTQPKDTLGTQYISFSTSSQPSLKYHMGWDARFRGAVTSALVLGADLARNQSSGYYWEGIGDVSNGSIPATGEDGTTYPYYGYLNSSAVYGQEVLGLRDRLFLTLGLRADRQDATKTVNPFDWSPRVGLAYSTSFRSVTAKIRSSFGAVPSPIPYYALQEQIYSGEPGQIYHANPNIKPSKLSGTDVGLELYFGRRASLTATYFDQTPKDQIDFVQQQLDSAGFNVGTFQNIGQIKNRGWEYEGRWYMGPLTLIGTYTPVSGKITRLSPDYSGALRVGDKLLNVPDWTASFTASLTLPKTTIVVTAAPTGRHLNYTYYKLYADLEAGTYDASNDRDLYIINYPGFTKYSLSVSQEINRRMQGFLSVQDLFNSGAIETYDYTITKSRVAKMGLRLKG